MSEKRPKDGDGRNDDGKDDEVAGFLARLRQVLDDRNMSQAALARSLDVGEATVSEWFTRGRVPQGDVFLRLPRALRVNGHWLLTGDGPPELEDPNGDAYRTGVQVILEELSAFRRASARRYGLPISARPGTGDESEASAASEGSEASRRG